MQTLTIKMQLAYTSHRNKRQRFRNIKIVVAVLFAAPEQVLSYLQWCRRTSVKSRIQSVRKSGEKL